MAYDIVIRGGEIVDGTGGEPRRGDVAIQDGRIAALGTVAERGAREIDADGLTITPGFVDIHTHPTRRSAGTRTARRSPGTASRRR